MNGEITIKPIAYIENDYTGKFGIPRQSDLVSSVKSKIFFYKEFRDENALRGIEQFSHLWLVWGFSENEKDGWSPTVRPPRLGGNKRMGVFATRSPFRPNPLGLSAVKLEKAVNDGKDGTVLIVSGADLMNGTPIYDIKPYIPYADIKENAVGGFSEEHKSDRIEVIIPEAFVKKLPGEKLEVLKEILALDPRPSYNDDENRIFGLSFAGAEIKFSVKENVLTVTGIEKG